MSSMGLAAKILPIALLCAAPASAQLAPVYASRAPMAVPDVGRSFADWRWLRQGGNFSFGQYAAFLNANPGWPGETSMRRAAERAMRPGESAATVLAFYRTEKPASGNGWMRYSEALQAAGRGAEAVAAAKEAWASRRPQRRRLFATCSRASAPI